MKIRLYLDEDSMAQALVSGLHARGVDVITALDAGMTERRDRDHLDYATVHGRVLCTFNVRDFYELHGEYQQQGKSHAGIILVPQQRYTLGEQLRSLLKLVATKSAESMMDQGEFLSAWMPELGTAQLDASVRRQEAFLPPTLSLAAALAAKAGPLTSFA